MFKKAEIEIYDLKLNDIIVTSNWDEDLGDEDDLFTNRGFPGKG